MRKRLHQVNLNAMMLCNAFCHRKKQQQCFYNTKSSSKQAHCGTERSRKRKKTDSGGSCTYRNSKHERKKISEHALRKLRKVGQPMTTSTLTRMMMKLTRMMMMSNMCQKHRREHQREHKQKRRQERQQDRPQKRRPNHQIRLPATHTV